MWWCTSLHVFAVFFTSSLMFVTALNFMFCYIITLVCQRPWKICGLPVRDSRASSRALSRSSLSSVRDGVYTTALFHSVISRRRRRMASHSSWTAVRDRRRCGTTYNTRRSLTMWIHDVVNARILFYVDIHVEKATRLALRRTECHHCPLWMTMTQNLLT